MRQADLRGRLLAISRRLIGAEQPNIGEFLSSGANAVSHVRPEFRQRLRLRHLLQRAGCGAVRDAESAAEALRLLAGRYGIPLPAPGGPAERSSRPRIARVPPPEHPPRLSGIACVIREDARGAQTSRVTLR